MKRLGFPTRLDRAHCAIGALPGRDHAEGTRETWMGVYMGDLKIGYLKMSTARRATTARTLM